MKIILFIFTMALTSLSFATPKAVILLRHAEEPKSDETYLSKDGVERSRRLVKLFQENKKLKKLGAPVAFFASGAKNNHSSVRSIQTLNFLSLYFKKSINDSYLRDDYKEMVQEILENEEYDNQVIVVCWSHDSLPDIAKKLGVKNTPDWPKGKFDRLWLLSFEKDHKVKFVDIPQHIMPGDDKK